MNQLFFENALLPEGWAQKVLLEIDAQGVIQSVTSNAAVPAAGVAGQIALPGMANLHSHAFQRAMAGLGEWAGAQPGDSFWSWREVMYRFLQQLRPQDLQAIAAQLYVEMLEAGFTAVGEFHYVHHQPGGQPYDRHSEMAQQIMAAAQDAGMGLTLLPVFYAQGGFGAAPVQEAQKRFYHAADDFLKLVEECRAAATGRTVIGIAPHSLRAVTPESLQQVVQASAEGPIHIHIAEQVKEVEDCANWSGARPVEWLLDNQNVDERWCLVHATHLNDAEVKSLAASGAVAGLCPITEANLGDGIFEGVAYQQAGGRWGIGSDSHIRIDLAEELRSYEYSQRLRDLGRNRLAMPGQANGRDLFDAALKGGAQALAQPMGALESGKQADIVSLDATHPVLLGKTQDDWLNGWLFAGDKSCVRDVWVSGKQQVKEGRHLQRKAIVKNFEKAVNYLAA